MLLKMLQAKCKRVLKCLMKLQLHRHGDRAYYVVDVVMPHDAAASEYSADGHLAFFSQPFFENMNEVGKCLVNKGLMIRRLSSYNTYAPKILPLKKMSWK